MMCLSIAYVKFVGQLKTQPCDFKVVELSADNAAATSPCVFKQTSLQKNMKRESCINEIFSGDESQHNISIPKRLKLSEEFNEKVDYSEVKFTWNTTFCKGVLEELLSPRLVKQIELLPFYDEESKSKSLLCLEVFENKVDRLKLHKCIRFLYPHLCTVTDGDHSISVLHCDMYQYFSKFVGKGEAESFLRFASILVHETDQGTHTISGNFEKETRRLIHRGIDRYFGKLLMSKTKSSGESIEVKKKELKKKFSKQKAYCKFVLYKRNTETLDAIHQLARHLHLRPHQFAYAGTKDKRAETWQFMTVEGTNETKLKAFSKTSPSHLQIDDVTVTPSPLRLGELSGNRFTITLRNVRGADTGDNIACPQTRLSRLQDDIVKSLEDAEKNGFVNYFGAQRFGRRCCLPFQPIKADVSRDDTDQSTQLEAPTIGLAILRQDMSAAVTSLLSPSFESGEEDTKPDVTDASKRYLWDTGDIEGTIKKLPTNKVRELSLLRSLRKFASNFKDLVPEKRDSNTGPTEVLVNKEAYDVQACTKALLSLPHNALVFYTHAYCSLVWNRAVTQRLRQFGNDIIEGDLVFRGSEDQIYAVTKDDVINKSYSIRDVVLPLPGNRVILPKNMEKYYLSILRQDGVLPSDEEMGGAFRVNQFRINLSGSYRKLVEAPKNLKYSWEKPAILLSDQPRSSKISDCVQSRDELDVEGTIRSASMNLTLTFDLPPSCYATTFLKEISKGGIFEK